MRRILSISLPERLSWELEDFARTSGRNKSDIVKESISLYLWEARLRQSRRRLSTKAKRVGVVTESDVFKAVS